MRLTFNALLLIQTILIGVSNASIEKVFSFPFSEKNVTRIEFEIYAKNSPQFLFTFLRNSNSLEGYFLLQVTPTFQITYLNSLGNLIEVNTFDLDVNFTYVKDCECSKIVFGLRIDELRRQSLLAYVANKDRTQIIALRRASYWQWSNALKVHHDSLILVKIFGRNEAEPYVLCDHFGANAWHTGIESPTQFFYEQYLDYSQANSTNDTNWWSELDYPVQPEVNTPFASLDNRTDQFALYACLFDLDIAEKFAFFTNDYPFNDAVNVPFYFHLHKNGTVIFGYNYSSSSEHLQKTFSRNFLPLIWEESLCFYLSVKYVDFVGFTELRFEDNNGTLVGFSDEPEVFRIPVPFGAFGTSFMFSGDMHVNYIGALHSITQSTFKYFLRLPSNSKEALAEMVQRIERFVAKFELQR